MLRAFSSRVCDAVLRQTMAGASVAAVRGLKETTGIVGLPVDPDARGTLITKIGEVLDALKVVPETAEYRKQMEQRFGGMLSTLDSNADDNEAEISFGAQLEEMVCLCEDELELIPVLAEAKAWDVPEGHTVEVVEEQAVPEKLEGDGK